MKKTGILIIFIVLVAAFTTAQAEVKADSVSVSPFVGYYLFEKNLDYKDAFIIGGRAGYNFTENICLEGFGSFLQTEIQNTPREPWMNIYSLGIEGLYHFMPEGRLVPFIALGVGYMHYGGIAQKISVDYGAGLKYFLTDNIALRADVRHVLPVNGEINNPDYIHNNLLATLGINFSIGGQKKGIKEIAEVKVEEPVAPVKVIADSDNDGIPDNLDKCPGTSVGVTVDKDGCPPPPPVVEQKQVIQEKVSITLNVEFATAKAVIKKKYYQEIKKVADFLKEHPETSAVIEGHTDNVDIYHEPDRNIRLSQERADSIRQYLIDKLGVDASRITAAGYGPQKPIASNDTKEGRRKNRRVEAVIEAVQIK